MSRSYKKNVYVKDKDKHAQRQANRRVRRLNSEQQNGCYYKRVYNSWDISDFKFKIEPSSKYYRKARNK